MKITFLDRLSFHPDITVRSPNFEHQWVNYDNTSANQVADRCASSQIVVTNKVEINRQTLEVCQTIKHIAVTATGYNIIDLEACKDHGVSVSNIPSYATTTVPEHVLNVSLSLYRKLNLYRQLVLQGKWHRSDKFCLFDQPLYDLKGKTFAVIGFGSLGEATGRLMHAIGMNVIYNSRFDKNSDFARYADLKTIFNTADVISLHCALTESTKDLISFKEFDKMKSSSILVNTARGGIANEQATVDAIKNNKIAGIAFDVLCTEPPTENSSPLFEIADQDNVILTPHSAWSSQDAMQNLSNTVIDNIEAFQQGNPINLVS